MKKVFLTAAILLTVSFVNAQVNFGVKAGFNSSLNFKNVNSVSSGDYNLSNVKSELNNGFHAGAFGRLFFNNIYIQPELLYSIQKKDYKFSTKDDANNTIDIDNHITFSTVDIPLLVGYKIADWKVANFRVFAGPKFRLNAGSEVSFKNLTNDYKIEREQLIGDFKNSKVGFEAGIGADLFMFVLDARLNMINDIYTANWQTKPAFNTNFVISLGWKIF